SVCLSRKCLRKNRALVREEPFPHLPGSCVPAYEIFLHFNRPGLKDLPQTFNRSVDNVRSSSEKTLLSDVGQFRFSGRCECRIVSGLLPGRPAGTVLGSATVAAGPIPSSCAPNYGVLDVLSVSTDLARRTFMEGRSAGRYSHGPLCFVARKPACLRV